MSFGEKLLDFWQKFISVVTFRVDSHPIDSAATLIDFGATRAAFVAQKTLYGYLKTRMGTRYPSMFENRDMIDSINIAKIHIYAACLSDVGLYLAAHGLQHQPKNDDLRKSLALQVFETGLRENEEQVLRVESFSAREATKAFHARLDAVDWSVTGTGGQYFVESPKALLKWAPIAPELKRYDGEIVRNSILLNWHTIRQKFAKRFKGDAVYADLISENQHNN